MTTRHLIDPEIVPVLAFLPELDLSHDALPIMRAGMAAMERPGPVAIPDIRMIPGRDGAPDVPLHIFNADRAIFSRNDFDVGWKISSGSLKQNPKREENLWSFSDLKEILQWLKSLPRS